MIRRPPRSTLSSSSAASDVYKRQVDPQHPRVRVAVWAVTVLDQVGQLCWGLAAEWCLDRVPAEWCLGRVHDVVLRTFRQPGEVDQDVKPLRRRHRQRLVVAKLPGPPQ